MDTIWAVADALGLERPVIMGGPMGGRVALHLAMKYPRKMRAVIGLQSGLGAVLSLSGIVDEFRQIWTVRTVNLRRSRRVAQPQPDRAAEPGRGHLGRRCGTTCSWASASLRGTSTIILPRAICATGSSKMDISEGLPDVHPLTGEYDSGSASPAILRGHPR